METVIRAKFVKGVFRPLETVEIPEGEEVTVSIRREPTKTRSFCDVLDATAGGWKDLIDADELKKNIYNDRLISTRPGVEL